MARHARSVALALGSTAITAAAALAQQAEVVLAASAHAGATTRAVAPGRPDLTFTNFSNAFRSAGNHWITVATVSGGVGGTATDQVVVTGSGLTAQVAAQEGVTAVGSNDELLNLSGLANPQINDSGQWAIAFTPVGSTTGLAVKWNGSAYQTVARAGDPAESLGGGVILGSAFSSAGITNAGAVSFINSGITTSLAGTTVAAFASNGTALSAANWVTVPTNQLGDTLFSLSGIDSGASTVSMQVTPDGSSTLLMATLAGVNARVVLLNNRVMLQVGGTLAGTTDVISAISAAWLESDGTWFARGTAGSFGFIVRNGAVIARIGSPITPGSTETWTGFTDFKGNNRGQYVVTGTTSAASASNNVLVLNGSRVVARAGNPVALENDGQFNDSLYIHSFRDRCFLGNDGYFYVGARLKSAPDSTSSLGANVSLIRIAIPSACNAADVAGLGGVLTPDGQLTADDVIAFLDAFFAGNLQVADIAALGGGAGADGQLTADDVIGFLSAFFAGCA